MNYKHSAPTGLSKSLSDGRVKFTFPNGKTEERDMKAGEAIYTPAVRHLPENMTDGDMEVVLIEMKTPKRRPRAKTAAPANTNP